MKWSLLLVGLSLIWIGLVGMQYAEGSTHFEISAMGDYSATDYGNGAGQVAKRYTGTLGWYFTKPTELELSYTYADTLFTQSQVPTQTLDTNEQTLALTVNITLVPTDWIIQPYVKAGGAQYNRTQNGTENGVATPEDQSKSPSAVLGAGIRIFISQNFSLKAEGVTYLPDFHISAYRDNFALEGGLGWHF